MTSALRISTITQWVNREIVNKPPAVMGHIGYTNK